MFKRNVTQGYFVPASVLSMYEEGGELKYQEGGQAEDPMQQIMMMAQQAVQEQNPDMAMQACQMLVEVMSAGGQEEADEEMEDVGEEQVPMARQGMEIYDDNQDLIY